jgi:hypothetical protein
VWATTDGVWIFKWTTYAHHLELQVITALSLISTIYKSPQHPLSLFPACRVFINRSLATASNSGDSSASRAQVLSLRLTVQNSTITYQLNYSAISLQPPLQSSTELPTLNWTNSLLYNHFARTEKKTPFPTITLLLYRRVYRSVA